MKKPAAACVSSRLLPVIAVVCLLAACATVPETGRHERMKHTTSIAHEPAVNEMVQRVGRRIAAVAPLPGAQWEFVVFSEPKTVNAFCLPGGKVGVYTGILPITRDETGLATVLGHEISHAVAHHGGERMSEGLLIEFGGQLLSEAMSRNSGRVQELAKQAYGIGSTVGVALPHSREQELEADHLGLIYMARAGYDPRQAIEFWKRMEDYSARQGSRPIPFLSTHPIDEVRVKKLDVLLPQAMEEYRKAGGQGQP
jgi:predicted Zn-dependent protease